jgi:hypothetical protein
MSKELLTRNDIRKMGLNYTNTSFQRWERAELLTAIKMNGRSSRVYYRREQVEQLINGRSNV